MLKLLFFALSLIPSLLFSQSDHNDFIEALISGDGNIRSLVDESELKRSERLDVQYTGVINKFLISYDIDENIKAGLKEGKYSYRTEETTLPEGYSKITMRVTEEGYEKTFYFHNGKFISPTKYLTRGWQTKESKYFIFKISNSKYYNDYCVDKLDEFVDSLCSTLNVGGERKQLLQKNKIYYIFCKNESEVEILTGFKTRGMYMTAFDEVITSYNTHYHEVAHLLINFKLQNLGLYTLPFFLEGFAVAVGGRGGMSARVVTDLGYYLQQSGFLTYDSIITNQGFYSYDANMTYAVAGLYNLFLLGELGLESYLGLYRSVNGDLPSVRRICPDSVSLPSRGKYEKFLSEYDNEKIIKVDNAGDSEHLTGWDYRVGTVERAGEYYKFFTEEYGFFTPADKYFRNKTYKSKIFFEKFGNTLSFYGGIKYGLLADSTSVKLFDLYTNELIASYDKNLVLNGKSIPRIYALYVYFIRRNVFRGELDDNYVIEGDAK